VLATTCKKIKENAQTQIPVTQSASRIIVIYKGETTYHHCMEATLAKGASIY
jgi:hypothetical protein